MADHPPVTAFDEPSALYALMQGDPAEARRICTAMSRTERTEFASRLTSLHEILDDLNATLCVHCGQRITKVPRSAMRNAALGTVVWSHSHNFGARCDNGTTTAEPAPQEN